MADIWVVDHGDGRTTEHDTKAEALAEAGKKKPVFLKVPSPFPRVMYKHDRTTRTVHNERELNALMAENDGKNKRIWGTNPLDFGVETCPGAERNADKVDRW